MEKTKTCSKRILTDCPSVKWELISALDSPTLEHGKSLECHIYDLQTLQENASKIALILQHRVELFVHKEILEAFHSFVASLQEKYPLLFCRELAVNVVE